MRHNNSPVACVGAIVFHNDAVLLVQRKHAPGKQQWAIPGGRILPGETLQQAAEREVFEETALKTRAGQPVFSFDLIERDHNNELLFHYVIVDLEAKYLEGNLSAGDDALKAAWVSNEQARELELNPITRQLLIDKYHFSF